jgi:glutathione S-transferase
MLKLYYHPLASYCWKTLIALYENGTPFTAQLVNLQDPVDAAAFKKLWPIGKFPVLVDESRNRTIPESSTIIEYLTRHYPGPTPLVPADGDHAFDVRARDRFFDLHIHNHMQKVIVDRMRPAGQNDTIGVADAKEKITIAYDLLERDMATRAWACGDTFSMADCAAAPALFYGNVAVPFGTNHRHTIAYLERLKTRPSFARVLKEAEPYFAMVPK